MIPIDVEYLFHEAIAQLGWSADATMLAERVKRLDQGLPAEDEFCVLSNWLGRCRIINKIDQHQTPAQKANYQAPDLVALYEGQMPVLIEVKTSRESMLSFKPNYLSRLRRYADALNFPLLIAWKCNRIWTLFDVNQLKLAKVNFNISIFEALKQSLLCTMVGDVAFTMAKGAGYHLRLKKIKMIDVAEYEKSSTWEMMIEKLDIFDSENKIHSSLSWDAIQLFDAWPGVAEETHSDSHVDIVYTAGGRGMEFAHTVLSRLLTDKFGEKPRWRDWVSKDRSEYVIADFRSALRSGLANKLVQYVLDIRPLSMPGFIATTQAATPDV